MVGKRLSITLTIIFAAISFSTAISAYVLSRKCKGLKSKILELETSLKSSLEKRAFERQRRIRTQQLTYYPMAPIGTICSCFSTSVGMGHRDNRYLSHLLQPVWFLMPLVFRQHILRV
ncbi:uncharacterized protein [Arachis hypogaea]|uniref:uncharacterized protein isoform X2 n=1 Tax=Arachis hypogaea TaxID=3818 RepID=UPI003B20EC63